MSASSLPASTRRVVGGPGVTRTVDGAPVGVPLGPTEGLLDVHAAATNTAVTATATATAMRLIGWEPIRHTAERLPQSI